jgi:L-ascorbate 6-phosphate lactonase
MGISTSLNLMERMDQLEVPQGCLAVWALGQMGFAVKGQSPDLIYIDPYLSNSVPERFPAMVEKMARSFPPPCLPADIRNAACVLVTHDHLDHADPDTLGPLAQASSQARFLAGAWSDAALDEAGIPAERRIRPDVDRPIELGDLRIWAVPAAHYDVEFDQHKGYRFFSYLIEWNGVRLFHSGDTLIYPGYVERLRALPAADIAILAVNGRDAYRESFEVLGNLMPAEAVWLAKELGWDTIIAGHNDLFPWNTLSPGALSEAVARLNPRQKFHQLQPGELFFYVRS